MPITSNSFPAIRLGLFFVLALLINCVMDGLPRTFLGDQICVVPFTLTFLIAFYYFLHPEKLSAPLGSRLGRANWRSCLWLSSLFVVAGYFIILAEAHSFHQYGYQLYPVAAACLFGAVALALVFAQSRQQMSARSLLLIVLACYFAIEIFSIVSFPPDIRRSDMLAMIQAAGADMARGHNPYHYFTWPTEWAFCPYLPALIGAYIPGVLLHLDLRWLATAYMLAGASLIFWATRSEHRRVVAATLSTFLLGNYLIFRHELYLQIHWLVLIIMSICLCRRWLFAAAVAMGTALAISQLTLAIFPFLLLHAWQKESFKKALQVTTVLLGTAACIISPYAITNPRGMFYGTVERINNISLVRARPMNLAYWIAHFIQPNQLRWVQFAALVVLFGYAILKNRCRDAAGCLAMMMVAFLSFIMMSIFLDGYFYLTFLVLVLAYLCTVNKWWRETAAD